MTRVASPLNIAIVGAGVAGASCARALLDGGHAVTVFDKGRGCGGRLATRQLQWADANGQAQSTHLDHGAPGFQASAPDFKRFVDAACAAGWLSPWAPDLAGFGLPLRPAEGWYLPVPDMPALCRHLLAGATTRWATAVDRLTPGARGWSLHGSDETLAGGFDAVLLAIPPAQAAPLLAPLQAAWAQQAQAALMAPIWTLMGVARTAATGEGRASASGSRFPPAANDPSHAAPWGVSLPAHGPLAWVVRNTLKPGRAASVGQAHWVAHANTAWSQQHLEQPAAWVQAQLQQALDEFLQAQASHDAAGSVPPLDWLVATVHRWRYAQHLPAGAATSASCWWDAPSGLGVCGDFLSAGGVEGAWLSAQALVQTMAASPAAVDDARVSLQKLQPSMHAS